MLVSNPLFFSNTDSIKYHWATAVQLLRDLIVINIFSGVAYGHTGHVRFLTYVENPVTQKQSKPTPTSLKNKTLTRRSANAEKLQKQTENTEKNIETLIISGGDGYEDFRSSSTTEDAGREDSTNHLLLWRV